VWFQGFRCTSGRIDESCKKTSAIYAQLSAIYAQLSVKPYELGGLALRVRPKGTVRVVRVPVWVRPDTEKGVLAIAAVCCLSRENPPAWIGTIKGEYWSVKFSVAETNVTTGVDNFEIPDRKKLRQYLPKHVRPKVMPLVIQGIRGLIRQVKPPFIWGVTFEQHPSNEDLKRYLMLINALHDTEGYKQEMEGTNPKGQRFWTMRRTL
jgi:hypothetical protein